MKYKVLSAILLSSMFAGSAMAQDRAGTFDDRWYLSFGAGANHQDHDRGTRNTPTYNLGGGKFINPNWSVDMEIHHQNPRFWANKDLNWSQYGVSLDARRHFRQEGRVWNPYLLMGVGYAYSEEEYVIASPGSPAERHDGYATGKLGAGLQGDFERVSVRTELYARTSFDDTSVANGSERRFTDTVAQLSVLVPLGQRTVAEARPAPEVVWQEEQQDHEFPQYDERIVVELPVVFFEFDRSDLTEEGRQSLVHAAQVLREHPDLRARIEGHTDSKGSESYNQRLSERRARAAADYLVSLGVDPAQLVEVVGYGESRPIAPNTHEDGSDNPQGRAYNRRAEIKPQE